MKKIRQFPTRLLTVVLLFGLLFSNYGFVLASNGTDGPDPDGPEEGSVTVSKQMKIPGQKGSGGISPNAVQPVPGGGKAYAENKLSWKNTTLSKWMKCTATSGLDTNVTGYFWLKARVYDFKRDGVFIGQSVWKESSTTVTGGAKISIPFSKSGNPYEHYWFCQTLHHIYGGPFNWEPSINNSVQL